MRTRREILRVGGLGAFGITLSQLLSAQKRAVRGKIDAKADACIVICLNGGPSHLDMWDLKPSAPVEIRGEFVPISTLSPGVVVCEHLPRLVLVKQ